MEHFSPIATTLLILTTLVIGARTPATSARGGSVTEFAVPSDALKANLLGDPPEVKVAVYLPPGYNSHPNCRYPSLYLLHGYLGSVDYFGDLTDKPGDESLTGLLDAAMAQAVASKMIVIVPEASNAYFGSFYANSVLIGNWEDAIVREVVPWIDSRFRTIGAPESRGIAGHSMGGYGSIMLAMKNPDVFGALYALSPCCIALIDDWGPENVAWSKALRMRSQEELNAEPQTFEELYPTIFIAMAAAFSPDPTGTGLRVRLPFAERAGHLIPDEPTYSAWKGSMPLYQVEQYQDRLRRLRGIYLDFGAREELTHIRSGTRMLSGELAALGIPHTFDVYADGTHSSHLRQRIKSRLLPFFSEVLGGPACSEVRHLPGEHPVGQKYQ